MASPLDDFPDSDSHWIRLYRKLKERHAGIAASILSGECDDKSYASECGRYGEVAKTIADMEAMTRGEDRPKREAEADLSADW